MNTMKTKLFNLLFFLSICSFSQWNQVGNTIIGSSDLDLFGKSIAISADGSRVIVGATQDDGGRNPGNGYVRVFDNSTGQYIQLGADLLGESIVDSFGFSVDISQNGNIIAIGAPFNDGNSLSSNIGSVKIYQYISNSWVQLGNEIIGESNGDESGYSISLNGSGNTIAIGARRNDTDNVGYDNDGHVRVYNLQSGNWTQIGNDIDGTDGKQYGTSVSISSDGNILVMGSLLNGAGAKVYENISGVWQQIGNELLGTTSADRFGETVDISANGQIIAIGAPKSSGNGYVNIYQNVSDVWTQINTTIFGNESGDQFGKSISLSSEGNVIAIGAPFNGSPISNAGSVKVYENKGNSWIQFDNEIGSIDGNDFKRQIGSAVSISSNGSIIAIGVPEENGTGFGTDGTGMFRAYANQNIVPNPFITKWETTTANDKVWIPLTSNSSNFTIDWGDGTIENYANWANPPFNIDHTYMAAGEYIVKVSGDVTGIEFVYLSNAIKLKDVMNWGNTEWSEKFSFAKCTKMDITATDTPNLNNLSSLEEAFYTCYDLVGNSSFSNWDVSSITNMRGMFSNMNNFNQDISSWDTSNVTNMSRMFYSSKIFNQDISNWNTSKVTDISEMFMYTNDYNKNISNWDTSKVTNIVSLFRFAKSFNQDVSMLDISNITDLTNMFYGASSFNQDISGWDTGNITNMTSMFQEATSFNQNIGSWDISNVTDIGQMFFEATSFNQDISNWDISKVSSLGNLFREATAFNQNIGSWDTSNITFMGGVFYGATSFNQDISVWDTSKVTYMRSMFEGATSFNQNISDWDTGSCTNLWLMFSGATSFNQDLGSWNIDKVSNMQSMLDNSGMSSENYDKTLIGWSNLATLKNYVNLGATGVNFCNSSIERQSLIDSYNWTITDDGKQCPVRPFITKWKTTSDNESITIPISTYESNRGNYNYSIDWGDGTIENNVTGSISHDYLNSGEHMVKITGDFPVIMFNNSADKDKILEVTQWGSNEWTSMFSAFKGCSNLQITAVDAPDLSNCTTLDSMFYNCISLNSNINHWNVSNISNLNSMFEGALAFNQPLNNWDVSRVSGTFMHKVFKNATAFNQSIDNWDVSNVTSLISLFEGATSFNQSLENWDVSNVFNMSRMFLNASSFNGSINSWNTSSLEFMFNTFNNALSFNQPLNNWDVSNVTSFSNSFNNALSFNQPINSWNVSSATDFNNMFRGATKFNQPLNEWDVSKVTIMVDMFSNTSLSVVNYDKTLKGWSLLPNLQTRVNIDANSTNFCNSETARNLLINTFIWDIDDAGKDCSSINTPTSTNGMWNDPANWSNGVVPTVTDNVVIPSTTTLQISADISEVNSLENEGTIVISPTFSLKSKSNMINNGTIVMDSDNGDSSVLFIDGTSTGNVVYKRGGLKANKWSLVTPPVSGQKIKEFATDVNNDIRTNTTVSPVRYAIGYYDDALSSDNKWSYYNTTVDENLNFVAGESYAVSRATEGSVTFTGTLTTSNITKSLKPGEWNAIGNPFTTYYPANKNGATSFINDNYNILDDNFKGLYIWDNLQNKYALVSELDIANRSLTPGQGFFIKVKEGEYEMQFNEDKRSLKPETGTTTFNKNSQSYIRLFADNGIYKVNTDIKFFNNATDGFDVGLDIGNFGTSSFDLYTTLVDYSNTKNYAIQSLGLNAINDVVIPLWLKTSDTTVTFSSEHQSANQNIILLLEDKLNNVFYDISNSSDKYTIALEELENIENRFYLHVSAKALSLDDDFKNNIQIYSNQKNLYVKGLFRESKLEVYNLLGQKVFISEIKSENITIPLSLKNGVYIVKLYLDNETIVKRVAFK